MGEKATTGLKTVLDGVISYLRDCNYEDSTVTKYQSAIAKIQRFYDQRDKQDYSAEDSSLFLDLKQKEYADGLISRRVWLPLRRAVFMSNEFYSKGQIEVGRRHTPEPPANPLSGICQSLLTAYLLSLKSRNLKSASIELEKYNVTLFLHYLDEQTIGDVSLLTSKIVLDSIPYIKKSRQETLSHALGSVRRFLEYLVVHFEISEAIPMSLSLGVTRHKKVIFGFTDEEANRILSAVDTSTPIGKRDFAIMTLAYETGLRSIDIKNMHLANIDWNHSEIQLIQSKTQKTMILPLTKNAGDAMVDYILHGRPECNSPYLFLSTEKPYGELISGLYIMVKKYAALSGVDKETKAAIGLHGFRRRLGVAMLDAHVPLSTISEVLGHAQRNTTKRYLSIDIERLSKCATPMQAYVPTREDL